MSRSEIANEGRIFTTKTPRKQGEKAFLQEKTEVTENEWAAGF
jgi:hypothetical protein